MTQAEYEKVMGTTPSYFSMGGRGADHVSGKDTSRHPVETASWEDVTEFCKRLSAKEGKTYRLPTEAEWEYACRAGTTTLYCFGDDPASLGEFAWYYRNAGGKTHPVGEKKRNAWGLHDMHGNVYEWCADWYGKDYYAGSPPDDPPGPDGASHRVIRGGSGMVGARDCRAAYRLALPLGPGDTANTLGFRVAAVPLSKSSQGQANKQAEPGAEAEASQGETTSD